MEFLINSATYGIDSKCVLLNYKQALRFGYYENNATRIKL